MTVGRTRRWFTGASAMASVRAFAGSRRFSHVQSSPAADPPPAMTAITGLVRTFAESNGVSAAQVALVRNGALYGSFAAGAKAPEGYGRVDSMSLFRLASCSKIFTCAAVDKLRAGGKLALDAKVFPLLEIDAPALKTQTPDARIDEITVGNLVDHAGGWNDHDEVRAKDGQTVPGTRSDPMFAMRRIATEMKLAGAPSKCDIARFMYGEPLQFAPGSQDFRTTSGKSYSNLGYMLLGLVIEKISGTAYVDFVRTSLPGAEDVSVSRTLAIQHAPREVWYVTPDTAPAADPHSNARLNLAYGGIYNLEQHDSAGGLMGSAETLATFLAQHAVWGMGGRAAGFARTGSLPGTSAFAFSRPNGVDCACLFNTRNFARGQQAYEEFRKELSRLVDAVQVAA